MNRPPNALCFGEDLPSTGAPSFVEVTPSGLTVSPNASPGGFAPPLVPFSELMVSAGGFDHDQLVVVWGNEKEQRTLYLKDPDLIRAFRRAAPAELTGHLNRAAEQVRRIRHRHRALWAGGIGGIIGLMFVLWFGTDLMVEWAVARVPIQWEDQLGAAAYRQMLAGQATVKEGAVVSAVHEMTNRLTTPLSENPYTFKISVVQSDMVNAFALPGGYVVVFTGLIEKAESGEEVAGVLSHELSHVLKRHGMKRIIKQLGLVTVVAIALGNHQGLAGLAQRLGMELVTLQFSRDQETEADLEGLRILEQASIRPEGMIRFFERLAGQEQHRVELLSTHPMSASRAKRLEEAVTAMPARTWTPFTFDWSQVQASLGRDHAVTGK